MNFGKIFGICALASSIALAGCSNQSNDQAVTSDAAAQTIKVGVMAGPEQAVAEVAGQVAKEKYNLTVELVEFNDYAMPNSAVSKGELDANAMQHKPYLEKDSQEKGLDNLVIVGNTFVYPLAGYSTKIKTLNELQDGATIAVPNDPSNLARALVIKEVDTSVAARAIDDVDLAVVNNNYAGQVGLTASENGVFVEDKDSPYVNIIVARADNKDSDAIQNFVKAYQTDEVEAEAKKQFKDGVIKGW